MRTKSLLAAMGCGLVLVVSGCGGGGRRLSAPEYAHVASDVCRRGNHAAARIDVPPLTRDRDASRAVARIVAVQRAAIDELRAARPPQSLAETVQKWIALLDQGTDELHIMSMRLHAGHTAAAIDYGAKATTLLDRAQEVVAPLRVTSCRGLSLPSV